MDRVIPRSARRASDAADVRAVDERRRREAQADEARRRGPHPGDFRHSPDDCAHRAAALTVSGVVTVCGDCGRTSAPLDKVAR